MKRALQYLLILLIAGACQTDTQDTFGEMPPLFSPPVIAPLNISEGYSVNPLTGERIEPLVNSFGDTIKTGIPLPVIIEFLDPDLVANAEIIPAGKPRIITKHTNVYNVPKDLTVIPLSIDSLRAFAPLTDTSYNLMDSPRENTKPAGVHVSIHGKVVPCLQPQPVTTPPLGMKDHAILNIRYLKNTHGISMAVLSILEDRQGNLWFGELDRGVTMYNGDTFRRFTRKEGLLDNSVLSILEDRQGNLWFGMDNGGVIMYNGDAFTHYSKKLDLSNDTITSICEDSQGHLWFGTGGGGVAMYNGESCIHFTEKEGLSHNRVSSILEDSQGKLWFGTYGGGVTMYNGESFRHLTEKEGLSNNSVTSILEDHRGNLWFGTDGGGVTKYSGSSFTHFTEKEGLSNNSVTAILEDSHGNQWFGTNGGGVTMFNGASFTHFTEKEGLSNNNITAILEDYHGNIWMAVVGGVNMFKANSFSFITEHESLCEKGVRSILEDSQGNLWFATFGGEVVRYDGETFAIFSEAEGLSPVLIRSMLEDSHGNLWFGTHEGVIRYNGETYTHISKNQGFRSNVIRCIFEDSKANLWFGTNGGGVIRYNGETFSQISGKEGSFDYNVRSILEDRHGNLWFGTYGGGVIRYNGETFTHFTQKEGLCHNAIFCILEDSRGNLWFGTREGISVFNGETFTHYTEKQGLCHNSIMSILEDRDGNIWVSTDQGISHLVYESESAEVAMNNPEIFTYGFQDGLKDIDFSANAALLDRKNRIWWGGVSSLTMLDLTSFKMEAAPPSNMKLSWIEINEQFTDFRHLKDDKAMKMEFDSVVKFKNFPVNPKLPYRLNHLSFHFSAIDWCSPQKLMYSYKMEGLGDNWSLPSAETKADYRNLPHGTFTFKARAIGAAKRWSEIFAYTFTIRPPWWYSWWAYILYGCIALMIIWQYRQFLMRKAKLKAAAEIQKMEKEKLEELDHLKSRFFANISHEFRTPLTLIMEPINNLYKNKHRLEAGDKRLLGIMKKNVIRLQQLINQLLDLSKLETGKVTLQIREGDLSSFVRTIVLSFLSLAESKRIDFQHSIPELYRQVFYDEDKIEKILTNLISNAFKYTPQGGKIQVDLKYAHDEGSVVPSVAELSVRDTGEGIPREMMDKIFDRFFQVSSSHTREFEGTGIGLSLTKELVNIYRGEIQVESKLGEGSNFKVILPVSRNMFRDYEIVTIHPGQPEMMESGTLEKSEVESGKPEPEEKKITEGEKARPVILIVEDNADLRSYISRHLLNDYQIQEAENGKEGIARATECIPDLVISDLMMPEMDGIEMCMTLKNDERTSHIPIILLTAKADKESKLEGLDTGADDYIVKPFDSKELQIRIKNLIKQRKRLQEQFNRNFFIDDRITELKSADVRFLEKAKDILDKHLSDPGFSVESLSRYLGLSRSQLYRKLAGMANQSPSEFIRKLRLKHSLILLDKGFDNIAQIAYQVGFSDPSYYAQCFRKLYGVSPSEYAKGQKKPRTASPG